MYLPVLAVHRLHLFVLLTAGSSIQRQMHIVWTADFMVWTSLQCRLIQASRGYCVAV